VALLTTLFGLIVAIIIQFFHNLFVSRIDKIIIDMEEGSVKLVDTLVDMDEKGQLERGATPAAASGS